MAATVMASAVGDRDAKSSSVRVKSGISVIFALILVWFLSSARCVFTHEFVNAARALFKVRAKAVCFQICCLSNVSCVARRVQQLRKLLCYCTFGIL